MIKLYYLVKTGQLCSVFILMYDFLCNDDVYVNLLMKIRANQKSVCYNYFDIL